MATQFKNQINGVAFISYARKISETFSTASLSFSKDFTENGETVKKYLNIKITSKIDLTKFEGRVQFSGFFTGNDYKGKKSINMYISRISELPTGKGNSNITFTTKMNFVRSSDKSLFGTGSLRFNAGTKTSENIQYANINVRGSKEEVLFKDGEFITIKGFLDFGYNEPYEGKDGYTYPVIVARSIIQRGMSIEEFNSQATVEPTQSTVEPTQETVEPTQATVEPTQEKVEIKDEEIPF